jgi:microcystin-dependent protein
MMSEPFLGEIKMFAGNFAPRGWAFCEGQLLMISQNENLFSYLGTIYGGDGQTTFGIPDLRGRIPIHAGAGPGLTQRNLGTRGGSENVTLNANELPSHSHTALGTSDSASAAVPANALWGLAESEHYADLGSAQAMNTGTIQNTGGNQSHGNVMPFLCVNFIIALFGIFPS